MSVRRCLQLVLAVLLSTVVVHAQGWIRSPAVTFAEMPPGTAYPEGITADAQGNIYVADFDVSNGGGPGNVVVFDPAGRLLHKFDIAGSSGLLLGIAFQQGTGRLLVLDMGYPAGSNPTVWNVDPKTGAATVFSTLPAGAGPNALAFDPSGAVYVSDSFLGTIWRIPAGGGAPLAWVADPLLLPNGVPPFGANGIAFNSDYSAMFVANTSIDAVIKIPVTPGFTAGTPEAFVYSINGADGLVIDNADNLWVAANQSDEIVVVDPAGRVIAKLGDFDGLDPGGMARGLLFPASLVFSDGFVYVTNLALDLKAAVGAPTVDSPWAAAVTRFNIARIRANIPPVRF